jgi:hypothetical protein
MAVIRKTNQAPLYFVIHPLDDEPEKKCDVESAGRMAMSPAVKISLFALQAHLVLMGGLVLYHVLDLAGLFTSLQ